jgi:hypothetical protein
MGMHTAQPVTIAHAGPGVEIGRVVLSLIGGGALVVGAFLDWTRGVVGTDLTDHSLYRIEFGSRTDIVQTVGGIAIVLGLLAVLGLVDRTGWLTRLAGALGVILFALFAIEDYRSSFHSMQTGAWVALAGGVVLLFAGLLGPRPVAELPRRVVDERVDTVEKRPVETVETVDRSDETAEEKIDETVDK